MEPDEGYASFVTVPLPDIAWARVGPGCDACRKSVAFLAEMQKEILELWYTINTTYHEDRMSEKITARCRLCGTPYDWHFAKELWRSLDRASVHLERVRKVNPQDFRGNHG